MKFGLVRLHLPNKMRAKLCEINGKTSSFDVYVVLRQPPFEIFDFTGGRPESSEFSATALAEQNEGISCAKYKYQNIKINRKN